jgi:hypothetical protein
MDISQTDLLHARLRIRVLDIMRIPVLRLVHGVLVIGIRIRCGLRVRARVVGVLLYAAGGGEGELARWDGGAECPGDEGAEHRV